MRRRGRAVRFLLAAVVLAFVFVGSVQAQSSSGPPAADERVLVEVRPPRASDLVAAGFDLWETNADRALVLADRGEWDALTADGYALTVVRRYGATRQAAAATFGPGAYHDYAAVLAELQAVAAAHPSIVTLRDLGPSWETKNTNGGVNRHLWAARITGAAGSGKPAVLYVAEYHAREVVTPELALDALHMFVDDYGRDPLLTYLVDNREIWIVPMANPDGWARVAAGAEWWRKNADTSNSADCGANPGTNANASHPGVDENRNHAFEWNAPGGASTDPCTETYEGPAPETEPEVQAIETLVKNTSPTTLITWHSYGDEVLWPWGYKYDPSGADPVLNAFGGRLAQLTGYTGGPAGSTLYLTSGELTDWAWATKGVAGVTIEVGALSDAANPFAPPYANMPRYWRENEAAALYVARVGDNAARAYGPDPAAPAVTAPLGAPTAAVSVALTAGAGGAPTAAELFLDAPGTEGTGQPGVLGSGGATATWSLLTAGVVPGRHAVFVRARDAAGHWGPLNAAGALVAKAELRLAVARRNALFP